MFLNLRSYLNELRRRNLLCEINAPVDPYLEVAEIHRRVIKAGGSALLFKNIRDSSFPVVTNLYGTKERVELAFGTNAQATIASLVKLVREDFPPNMSALWGRRSELLKLLHLGTEKKRSGNWVVSRPSTLKSLPALTTWQEDGGPFLTLPLVYTEHPETHQHNLGMYRMQIFDEQTTGLHMQIGKGGGFHLAAAAKLNRNLPVNVFLGGPPAVTLSAIAPLPENVPELLLASLVQGGKVAVEQTQFGPLPILSEAEFAFVGECNPQVRRPEGPFGDHYGYYSLTHDFPVFNCQAMLHRPDAIFPATVVGKPRQEDFYLGDFLQELLSPLFPLVMPAVRDLWSYGETGYHSLAAAVVHERYKREAMASAFRILGEGQLSLTKFLLVLDRPQDLKNFRAVLEYVLERADFRTDLYVFSNLSMDTLDYSGPTLNEGSKGVLLGMGEPIRKLPREFSSEIPNYISKLKVFSPGCLVISGPTKAAEPTLAKKIANEEIFSNWPLIVLCDNAAAATQNDEMFLWTTFTRFEPAADLHGKQIELHRFHPSLTAPLIIDARLKPDFPAELECDEETRKLVDRRWKEYFPS